VRSLNSHGVVAIRDREVTHGDVEHVIDAAKAVRHSGPTSASCHVLPQEFLIDARKASATRSACRACASRRRYTSSRARDSAAQNIIKCVQRCGLVVEDVVLEQLASSFCGADRG